ncbi:hypothetical protein [Microbacterium sp. TPD7012]|uniref:hypothetical protein n=1 Tax=Microbacterium sp. TPD7012 TaxID=2171975 RepID=UPI000D523F88|nr:hypothetical protein [Microbacterium sp. TPD7012]PVE92263.1 hypothetical protein DC434_17285 [Microbacterium sp. TPD7012]
MNPAGSHLRPAARLRLAVVAAVLGTVGGALIWMLWVLPIVASVDRAEPHPLGDAIVVDLDADERAGIWAQGISANLGSLECVVVAPGGEPVAQRGAPALDWSSTLWWMTPKPGFEQTAQFTAPAAGPYEVRCADSLDIYDGAFLIAGDSFGGGSIGLGRGGGADYPIGTMLSFGAVFLPPFAVAVTIIVLIRVAASRRTRRRAEGMAA